MRLRHVYDVQGGMGGHVPQARADALTPGLHLQHISDVRSSIPARRAAPMSLCPYVLMSKSPAAQPICPYVPMSKSPVAQPICPYVLMSKNSRRAANMSLCPYAPMSLCQNLPSRSLMSLCPYV